MTDEADEFARLRDRYVERNVAIMGGEPVIRGTRVPVRTIAGLIEQGESREVMREDYPQVPEEAFAVAPLGAWGPRIDLEQSARRGRLLRWHRKDTRSPRMPMASVTRWRTRRRCSPRGSARWPSGWRWR